MTAKDILIQWLTANGYDGLFNRNCDCGCDVSDLVPCGTDCAECEPGYKGRCSGDEMCDACAEDPAGWHIGEVEP